LEPRETKLGPRGLDGNLRERRTIWDFNASRLREEKVQNEKDKWNPNSYEELDM
jgi:hypothetical protein